ncbi:cation efflux protein [Pisolithus thermaeus]|nr:cation efflux protein [Pisolithus croceorrhizus]KAI6164426.1 cation efflux protein [Pisolithus thermaeus]
MAVPDARTRRKISLQPAKVISASLSSRSFPRLFVSNVLFVLTLFSAKEWLLSYDVGVFWVVMRVLAIGGLSTLMWEAFKSELAENKDVEWTALGLSSFLVFMQQASLYTALYRLSSPRVILFTHFSTSWVGAVVSSGSIQQPIAIFCAFALSFLCDAAFSTHSPYTLLPGYGCLVLHGLATYVLEYVRGVLSPSLSPSMTTAASTLGATLLALPFYAFKKAILDSPPSPVVPLLSLAILPLLTYSMVFLTPETSVNQYKPSQAAQSFLFTYPLAFLMTIVAGHLGFGQSVNWTDLMVGSILYYALYPGKDPTLTSAPRTPVSKLIRFYLNSVLSDNESRKIFYFLVLNMCYMLIQMLYGVWTNSLGLISDAIHMAFDCLAIGVGLFASIMAKWPPNERFTYGYGRIETLSGFANGIFLILISVFIVFEAVERILDPPEMTTSQLLLVSSLGLAVNLFGMFAMGGHHHHHGHGHSHDHCGHSQPQTHSHAHNHSTHLHDPKHDHAHRAHNHGTGSHIHHDHFANGTAQCNVLQNNVTNGRKSHSRGPSLITSQKGLQDLSAPSQVPFPVTSPTSADSPISPNYPKTLQHDHHHTHHCHDHHDHGHNHHTHSHGHGHDHEGHSHNMRGVFLHVMADTLGSVGVIVSTLLIQYYGWTGFDPIASIFIAVLIAASVIPLVIDTGRVLSLDLGDNDSKVQQALSELSHIEGVASYSSPRFWPKDSTSIIGSIHIQLSDPVPRNHVEGPSIDQLLERVNTLLRSQIPGLEELTIQFDQFSHPSVR